jgi:hypothetical protein
MPNDATVYTWIADDEDISRRIARARARGYDAIALDCMIIADEDSPVTPSGSTDSGHVQHRKLRIDTRLKLLAKWDPKRYGDKLQDDSVPAAETMAAALSKLIDRLPQ